MKFIHTPFFFFFLQLSHCLWELRRKYFRSVENNNAKNEHELNSYGNEKIFCENEGEKRKKAIISKQPVSKIMPFLN